MEKEPIPKLFTWRKNSCFPFLWSSNKISKYFICKHVVKGNRTLSILSVHIIVQ